MAASAKTVDNERRGNIPTKGYKNSINPAVLINSVFIWRDKQKLLPTRSFRLIRAIVLYSTAGTATDKPDFRAARFVARSTIPLFRLMSLIPVAVYLYKGNKRDT